MTSALWHSHVWLVEIVLIAVLLFMLYGAVRAIRASKKFDAELRNHFERMKPLDR